MFKIDYEDPATFTNGSYMDLKAGDAKFKVLEIQKTDRNGQEMFTKNGAKKITIILSVTDQFGNKGNLFEQIYSNSAKRIYSLLKSVGCEHLYQQSGVDIDKIVGKTGECTLEIKPDYKEELKPQIKWFKAQKPHSNVPPANFEYDTDVPF